MNVLDFATREIYGYADHGLINSWLRTLADIRGLPERPAS